MHSARKVLGNVSLIAEEPTLTERVALMLHPAYAPKGTDTPCMSSPPVALLYR